MYKRTFSSRRMSAPQSIASAISAFLDARGGKEHAQLVRLWEHWNMVMGEELASLAIPLGHKKGTLLLAAEDSMAAQDIAMQSGEVLERVNAFMNSPYFSRIQVELAGDRQGLDRTRGEIRPCPAAYRVSRPESLGRLQDSLDRASSVTRCYQAYLRYFSEER